MAAQLILKPLVQGALRRAGFYQRVKSSCIYDIYWMVADKQLLEHRSKEVEFYRSILKGFKKGDLIFDVGANQGYKTDIFLRLGARVVAVEPDEFNQEILEQRFSRYRIVKKPVVVVGKAVSEQSGTETMWIDEPGSAKNTLNPKWVDSLRSDSRRFGKHLAFGEERKIETVTLEELFKSHGRPYYVKIDVEGYEASVLRGLQSLVPYISFEVNLPEFRTEAVECIGLLERVAPNGLYNYAPDCLQGLAFENWLPTKTFLELFNDCEESCVEVYWKAPISR
jgi:FkbM family methyltransferase